MVDQVESRAAPDVITGLFHRFFMNLPSFPPLYPHFEQLGSASAYVDDVFDVLKQEVMFEDFSRQEIEVLCLFMQCFAAPRTAELLTEGQEGDHLLVILTGQVLVRKHASSGLPVSIAMVGPGDILGEMSLIDGACRFASCVATEPVDFAVMRRADLNEILIMHPRLANKFLIKVLQIMVNRMRDAGLRALSLSNGSTPIV